MQLYTTGKQLPNGDCFYDIIQRALRTDNDHMLEHGGAAFCRILNNFCCLRKNSDYSEDEKKDAWDRLANEWNLKNLESLASEISLDQLAPEIENIFSGKVVGRKVICLK